LQMVKGGWRDTRVAVRHIATFLKAGHTAEEIVWGGLADVERRLGADVVLVQRNRDEGG